MIDKNIEGYERPTKYGRSVGIEFPKPDFNAYAEEVNNQFGKVLPEDALIGEIYRIEIPLIKHYFDKPSTTAEKKQKLTKFRIAVGDANRAGIPTLKKLRELIEKDFKDKEGDHVVKDEFGNIIIKGASTKYLKTAFGVSSPIDDQLLAEIK